MARTGSKSSKKSEGLQQVEHTGLTCPLGHRLPHKQKGAECTPLYCATGRAPRGTHTKKEETAIVPAMDSQPVIAEDTEADSKVEQEQRRRMKMAAGRFAIRSEFLKAPTNLEGKDAEEWSDKKLVELLPLAVAHKEFMLKYGDDKQQDKASDDILAANGRGRRDAGGFGGPSIVIVSPDGALKVPWRQEPKTIEAKVVDAPE